MHQQNNMYRPPEQQPQFGLNQPQTNIQPPQPQFNLQGPQGQFGVQASFGQNSPQQQGNQGQFGVQASFGQNSPQQSSPQNNYQQPPPQSNYLPPPTNSAEIANYMKKKPYTQMLGGQEFTYSLFPKKQNTFLGSNDRLLMLKGNDQIAYAREFPANKQLPFSSLADVPAPKAAYKLGQIEKLDVVDTKLVINFSGNPKIVWEFVCPDKSCAIEWAQKIDSAKLGAGSFSPNKGGNLSNFSAETNFNTGGNISTGGNFSTGGNISANLNFSPHNQGRQQDYARSVFDSPSHRNPPQGMSPTSGNYQSGIQTNLTTGPSALNQNVRIEDKYSGNYSLSNTGNNFSLSTNLSGPTTYSGQQTNTIGGNYGTLGTRQYRNTSPERNITNVSLNQPYSPSKLNNQPIGTGYTSGLSSNNYGSSYDPKISTGSFSTRGNSNTAFSTGLNTGLNTGLSVGLNQPASQSYNNPSSPSKYNLSGTSNQQTFSVQGNLPQVSLNQFSPTRSNQYPQGHF